MMPLPQQSKLCKRQQIKIRSSYNLAAMSFTNSSRDQETHLELISYKPDFRQKNSDSWPASIDDHQAREDWNWKT
jgi:hypothetical protein